MFSLFERYSAPKLRQCADAERDLMHLISLADQEGQTDPSMVEALLTNYAFVLRKTPRQHEARQVEARAAILRDRRTGVVDLSELVRSAKLHKAR
jgi:hypothetical protein